MSATDAATADAASIARLVAGYQTLQATGCRVILIPNYQQPQTAIAEAQFLAGLAIILDNAWVAYPFWMPPQDWFKWPGQLGVPSGSIRQGGTTLWRDFKNGTLKIDASTHQVTIAWKRFHAPTTSQDPNKFRQQRFWPHERAILASRRQFAFIGKC
jgi:hypothetical protein